MLIKAAFVVLMFTSLLIMAYFFYFITAIIDLLAYSQQMSPRLAKADRIPECGCGWGKMAMRCAGKTAVNAGRYYMKCPANLNHSGSFQWCDEYIRGISGSSYQSYIDERVNNPRLGQERAPPIRHELEHPSGGRHYCARKAADDMKTPLLIVCVCILMVIVGILIGKLM